MQAVLPRMCCLGQKSMAPVIATAFNLCNIPTADQCRWVEDRPLHVLVSSLLLNGTHLLPQCCEEGKINTIVWPADICSKLHTIVLRSKLNLCKEILKGTKFFNMHDVQHSYRAILLALCTLQIRTLRTYIPYKYFKDSSMSITYTTELLLTVCSWSK